MSVRDLARHVCRVLGVREDLRFLPARHEVAHAHADHAAVHEAFPDLFARPTGIVEGLELMAEYVRSHRMPPVTECPSRIEITDRLPSSWAARVRCTTGLQA